MQIPINQDRFYVYEHLRMDTGEVFYVGKGTGKRAWVANKYHRNLFWQRLVAKTGGFGIRMVIDNIAEDLAFLVEIERIDQLRKMGIVLCNLTSGGDGISGLERTSEWREKIGIAHRGKTITQDVRDKISRSVRETGYTHSAETRERMSKARQGRRPGLGRKQPPEERSMRSLLGKGNKSRSGGKRSESERLATSLALRGKKQTIITCPHCGKNGGNAMRRWHFDFCKKATT